MSDRFRGQQYAFGAGQPAAGAIWGGHAPVARPLLGAGGQSWAGLQQQQQPQVQGDGYYDGDYDAVSGDEGVQSEGWSDAGSDNEDGADYNFVDDDGGLDDDQQWNGVQQGYALSPLQAQQQQQQSPSWPQQPQYQRRW